MIVTPKILLRLVALVIVGVLLQLCFFSRVSVFGTSPDMLPALVVVFGLLGGTMTGAVTGFAIGLLVDCLVAGTLGSSSLVLLGVGYLAGLFRERFEIHNALIVPIVCAALTMVAGIGFAFVQTMLGIEASVSLLVVRDLVLKSFYAFLIGWPLYAGLRLALRPALVEEPSVARRSEPTAMGA